MNENLAFLTVHSTFITGVSRALCLLLQVGGMVVLARLLQPGDFGLVIMVNSITGFLFVFKDLGLSMGTVQRAQIDHEQVNALFWVNVGISLALTITVVGCSPVLAAFYKTPELVSLTTFLAIAFIPSGLAAQHQAILKRQMRFLKIELANMIALAVGMAVGIAAALQGAGYWSLAAMHLARPVVNTVCLWIFSGWVPGRPRWASGAGPIIAFGGYFSVFNAMNFVLRNTDNILIGKYWGTQLLGFYGKAYELLMLPLKMITTPLASVFVPALSRIQDDPARFVSYYKHFLSATLLLTSPIIMMCVVEPSGIVEVVLGPQWQQTAHILFWLSFGMTTQTLCSSSGWLYIPLGRSREQLKYGSLGAVLFVVSFIVGVPYGATGVAIAYSIAMLLWTVPCMVFAAKGTPVPIKDIFAEFSIHALAMTVGGGVVRLCRGLLPTELPLVLMLTCLVFAGFVTYYSVLLGVFGRWRILRALYVKFLRPSNS